MEGGKDAGVLFLDSLFRFRAGREEGGREGREGREGRDVLE